MGEDGHVHDWMPLLVSGSAVAVTSVASLVYRFFARRAHQRRLTSLAGLAGAAKALGLQRVGGDPAQDDYDGGLAGKVDGMSVRVDVDWSENAVDRAVVRVEHPSLPQDLRLVPSGSGVERSLRALRGASVESRVAIDGAPLVRHAVLDGPAHDELVQAVAAHGLRLESGVVVQTPTEPRTSAGQLEADIRRAVAFAKLVSLGNPVVEARLAEIARGDPAPPIRRAALLLLTRHGPRAQTTLETCRAALDDRDDRVAVLAAIHLEDFERVRTIAASDETDGEACAYALLHLAKARPLEVRRLLRGALAATRPPVAGAALAILRMRPPVHDHVEELVPELVHLVGHEDGAIAAAAIELVGAHGSGEHVAALRAMTSGIFASRDRAKWAEEAVAAIQARIGPEALGALAVVEAPEAAGALSVAEPRGELSLTNDAGALSPVKRAHRDAEGGGTKQR